MASVNKNFVIKNGIEVADNVIFATAASGKVGIGSTLPSTTLDIKGQGLRSQDGLFTGILTATSTFYAGAGGTVFSVDVAGKGVGINTTSSDYSLHVVGTSNTSIFSDGDVVVDRVVSAGATVSANSLTINGSQVVSSARELQNIVSLDATTTQTIEDAIANAPNTFTDLTVTGISTLGTTQISGGIVTSTSGITTYYGDASNLTGITTSVLGGTNINVNGVTGIVTVNLDNTIDITGANISGVGTIATADVTNLTASGVSTLGTVKISSGIVTAASGIVTYYGDGSNLSGVVKTATIGVGSEGTFIGAGVTQINFNSTNGTAIAVDAATAGIATVTVTPGVSLGLAIALGG